MLEAEEIQKNWNRHLKIVDTFITGNRKTRVIDMLRSLEDTYVMAPASTKTWYHNAFPGGYVDHVNRVVQVGLKQLDLYKEMGGEIDFEVEELVFSCLFHDLGKLGDGKKPNYLPQGDKWRQEKLQEQYIPNPDLPFMLVPDRSLFLLQKHGIQVSQNEYLAIKLHDGVFEEGNKPYWFSYQPSSQFKTSIVHIVHTADYLSSKIEKDIQARKQQK